MPESYALSKFDDAAPAEIEAALEHGDLVFFERCPIELLSDADMAFLRSDLPQQSRVKNISYHPETDSVPRFDAPEHVRRRVTAILKAPPRLFNGYGNAAFKRWRISLMMSSLKPNPYDPPNGLKAKSEARSTSEPRKRRRWFQFTLKTFLLVMGAAGVGAQYLGRPTERDRFEVSKLKTVDGEQYGKSD